MTNYEYEASALYDGGWRSTDMEELMEVYNLTEEEAKLLCVALRTLEGIEND